MKKKLTAVILAAGESSRFRPLSKSGHKSLFKVGGKAIVRHAVEKLVLSGVSEIILVHSPTEKNKFIEAFAGLKIKIKYVAQKRPLGTGDALSLATEFIKSDFVLINGGHYDSLRNIKKLVRGGSKLKLLVDYSENANKFAVIDFANRKSGRIKEVVEKPKKGYEPSKIRAVGIYYLPENFKNYISKVRGINALIDAFNLYINDHGGYAIRGVGGSIPIKYAIDVLDVTADITNNQKCKISRKARISKKAVISGNVVIEDGAVIEGTARIDGPVYIGRNVFIGTGSVISKNSIVENGAKIGAGTKIKRSYIGTKANIQSANISTSVIGGNCRIGVNARITPGTVIGPGESIGLN